MTQWQAPPRGVSRGGAFNFPPRRQLSRCTSASHSSSSRSVAVFASCVAHAGVSARCVTAEIDASCVLSPRNSYDHRVVRVSAPLQQSIQPRQRRRALLRRGVSRGNRRLIRVYRSHNRGLRVGEAQRRVQRVVGPRAERSPRLPSLQRAPQRLPARLRARIAGLRGRRGRFGEFHVLQNGGVAKLDAAGNREGERRGREVLGGAGAGERRRRFWRDRCPAESRAVRALRQPSRDSLTL